MSPVDVVALFGAGVASFLAPCVLPLIPAYVGMIAGESAEDSPSLTFAAAAFVVGFSAIFVAFGALAGQLGSSLSGIQTTMQRVGGVLIAVFGLLLLAGDRGRVSGSRHLLGTVRLPAGRVARPLVMGVAFGAAWTPCVGPLLGAALVVAANSQAPLEGAVLLGAYSIGIGTPFVAIALAATSLARVPSWMARWSPRVAPFAAATLVAFGVLLASGLYVRLVERLGVVTS